MNKNKLILIAILILGAVLRLYKISSLPALNADEAALGYNAYSLLETGQDEHGNLWPLHFQSFNDYKPGGYVYLILPLVKLLGLNIWAVRLPGIAAGVFAVYLIYLLAKYISNKDRELIGLVAALMLAISPWHIHFSRGGWEVNLATTLMLLGSYQFLLASKKPKYYYLSILSFVFSLYIYHAARIVAPFLGLGLLVLFFPRVKANIKTFGLSILLGFVLAIPLLLSLLGSSALSRVAGVGLFADPGPLNRVHEQRGQHNSLSSPITKLIHNKPVNYGLAFMENWGEHYWGEFLFVSGDEIQRNRVPETGQMYLFDIVFVGFGLIFIVRNLNRKYAFILWWFLVAPMAAALTFQSPHALRSQNMIIPLVIFSTLGFVYLIKSVKKYQNIAIFLVGIIIFWNFARYLQMYYVHMNKEYPYSSQYGVEELVEFVETKQDSYEKIITTTRYDQPYILFLYYLEYPPFKFQRQHALTPIDKFGFSTVEKFGKFEFRPIDFDKEKPNSPNSLIIGTDKEIPDEANVIKNIYFPNGDIAFQVVAN